MSAIAESKLIEVLIFELAGQHYGLPASDVQEVVPAVIPVTLPKAPAVVEGVINIRGKIVPVLDTRRRFRLPPKATEPSDHFVVVREGERPLALHVDHATDLVLLDASDVEDAKAVVPGVEYVAWMAKLSDELVLIHDLRSFLSHAESAALEEALAGSAPEAPTS